MSTLIPISLLLEGKTFRFFLYDFFIIKPFYSSFLCFKLIFQFINYQFSKLNALSTSLLFGLRAGQSHILYACHYPLVFFALSNQAKVSFLSSFHVNYSRISKLTLPIIKIFSLGPTANSIRHNNVLSKKNSRPCRVRIILFSFSFCADQENLHFVWS
jgi:hypothetical protein